MRLTPTNHGRIAEWEREAIQITAVGNVNLQEAWMGSDGRLGSCHRRNMPELKERVREVAFEPGEGQVSTL